jgi:hypothetical protein
MEMRKVKQWNNGGQSLDVDVYGSLVSVSAYSGGSTVCAFLSPAEIGECSWPWASRGRLAEFSFSAFRVDLSRRAGGSGSGSDELLAHLISSAYFRAEIWAQISAEFPAALAEAKARAEAYQLQHQQPAIPAETEKSA